MKKPQSLRVFLGRAMTAACVSVVTFVATSVTATADPADNQANNDKLFALLSGGYTPADCKAGKQYPEDPFLARLGCGPNSQPGGPVGATYSLYGKPADLNKAFNVNSAAPLPCPGTTDPGPTPWQGGMVKCGSPYPHLGGVMLTWTRDADLLMANVNSSDLASLYAWWLAAR
jgi:serine/threonine kinase PknH